MKRTRSAQLAHQQPVEWRREVGSEGDLSDTDDEWWSDDSSCSTCSSEDERWKFASEAISGGELFYIECQPQSMNVVQKMKSKTHQESSRSSLATSKGTFAKIMKKNRKNKTLKNSDEQDEVVSNLSQSTTNLNSNLGEIIEVRLIVEPRRTNLGRRATLCEMMLGIIPGNLKQPSDDNRIIVAGFIPDMPASMSKKMKIGDWLQCIDGQQVFHSDIDSFLLRISPNSTVTLRLRRIEGGPNLHSAPYLLSKGLEIDHLLQIICKGSAAARKGSLLILDKSDKVVYNYPQGGDLISRKAIFITLCNFLEDLYSTKPQSTRMSIGGQPYTVLYLSDEKYIMVLAFPANKITEAQAIGFFSKFVEAVHFTYNSFVRCAADYKLRLNMLVDSLFSHMLDTERKLPFHTHSMMLPSKVQSEVDSALSTLEAIPTVSKTSTDMFFTLGSSLFYKNVCVRNHLPEDMLSPLTCLLWIHNILALEQFGLPLQRLLVWKEVFLSEQQNSPDSYEEPPGRYYILLLGQNELILAVLIKTSNTNESGTEIMKPSIAFIEQVQDTLDNLHLMGITNILDLLLEDKQGENSEKTSISDQHSNSSEQNFSHRSSSVEGYKRYSPKPKRNSSRLSVNSEGENYSETSSEASWNSSEVFSYGKLNRYRSLSRHLTEPFERSINVILLMFGKENLFLANNSLLESLDVQVDSIRLALVQSLVDKNSKNGVMDAIIDAGFVLASKGKKSDDYSIIACKKLSLDGSAKLRLVFMWSDDIGVNFNELSNKLAFLSL
ncbi:protein inturned-like isoform X2 [Neocloeon triangulifer]|uniref:protein inturned-like isoform X2 n=1 Tax=Neocloeon triangulifer TaxID=2078957 RepID=UPI00286F4A6D|nr:protein inturned-like isoform X2 [Neocloeon triangulifer]